MNKFAEDMNILSGKEIIANIPSQKDKQYLYNLITSKKGQIKWKEGICYFMNIWQI